MKIGLISLCRCLFLGREYGNLTPLAEKPAGTTLYSHHLEAA